MTEKFDTSLHFVVFKIAKCDELAFLCLKPDDFKQIKTELVGNTGHGAVVDYILPWLLHEVKNGLAIWTSMA